MIYQKSNSRTSQYFECIRYKDFSFFEHMHRNPELIYVRKGEISVITELGKERVTEGNFALVFPNRVHSYSSEGSSVVSKLRNALGSTKPFDITRTVLTVSSPASFFNTMLILTSITPAFWIS